MNLKYSLMYLFLYFSGVMKILSTNKMITVLMSIEIMMISMYFLYHYTNFYWFGNSTMLIVFLTFMVSESVMGLGTYIYITRVQGKDQYKSWN